MRSSGRKGLLDAELVFALPLIEQNFYFVQLALSKNDTPSKTAVSICDLFGGSSLHIFFHVLRHGFHFFAGFHAG